MKKLLLMVITTAFIYSFSFAATPPAAVQKAFTAKFPSATKVTWGKEGAKEWEAEFTFEGNKVSANFSEDGKWLETEREIKVAALPAAVAAAVKAKYPGWIIAEADKTETAKHGLIYEVDLTKGTEKKDAAFKEDGTPVVE
jgi:hypothetical protein